MTNLAKASIALGGLEAVLCSFLALAPTRARAWLTGFPRDKWAGRILTLAGMIWTEYLFFTIPLGQFDKARPGLLAAVPIVFVLIVRFMEDLLAARALGGLLLLVPGPLLSMARWHESPWRLVMVVIAYIMVIKGVMLVLGPHMFRRSIDFWVRSDAACRGWGAVGLVLACLLLVLGFTVF